MKTGRHMSTNPGESGTTCGNTASKPVSTIPKADLPP